jgi:dienelactone hydrolase
MRPFLLLLLLSLAACGESAPATDPDPDADPGPGPDASSDPDPDAAPAADPGGSGPYTVASADTSVATSLGTAQVTVYRPDTAGAYPLVVVSTGFSIGRGNYDQTCRHLASWGYVVVSHDYTSGNHQEKAAEVSELIDWALGSDAPIDPSLVATAGHSMGGKVSILAAIEDPRIGAVVGWDPVDALPPIGDGSISVAPERIDELAVPIAVIGETTDATGGLGGACAPAADNYTQYFDGACGGAAPAALEVTVDGADHTDWVDDRSACGLACAVCQQGATADATVLEITRRMTVAWLDKHLRGRPGLDAWLTEPGVGAPATTRECQ